MSSASSATCWRSAPPASRPALTDPKLSDRLPHPHRDGGTGGQPAVAAQVFSWKRFLQPIEVEVLEKVRAALGFGEGHGLVGVDHDVEVGSYRSPNRG